LLKAALRVFGLRCTDASYAARPTRSGSFADDSSVDCDGREGQVAPAVRHPQSDANYARGSSPAADAKVDSTAGWTAGADGAERRAGELLAQMEKDAGGRPGKTGNAVLPVSTLKELGIEKIESHRWQREASIPEEAAPGRRKR
jgi:hypothetical protein